MTDTTPQAVTGPVAAPRRQPVPAPLAATASLLREEPGLVGALGRSSTVLVVPEAARAVAVSGIVALSRRRPVVVAVPTAAESERLAADLAAFLPEGGVELFPAWETLPFERVSPSIETMGRRLRTLWRLRERDESLSVVVSTARALVQRLGPHVEDAEPVVLRPGRPGRLDRPGRASGRTGLPARVPGRAPRRAGGARFDHRRLPLHRGRARAHRPVGRRGGAAGRVLRRRPAEHRRDRLGAGLRCAGAAPGPRGARTRRAPGREPTLGSRAVATSGRRRGVRGHGGLARVAGGPRARPVRPRRRRRTDPAGRSSAAARPRRRHRRGGSRSGSVAVAHLGPGARGRRVRRGAAEAARRLRSSPAAHRGTGVVGGQRPGLTRQPDRRRAGLAAGGGRGTGPADAAPIGARRWLPGAGVCRQRGVGRPPRCAAEPERVLLPDRRSCDGTLGVRAAHARRAHRRRIPRPGSDPPGRAAGAARRGRPDGSPAHASTCQGRPA